MTYRARQVSAQRYKLFFCSAVGGIFRGHLQIQENAFLILKLIAKRGKKTILPSELSRAYGCTSLGKSGFKHSASAGAGAGVKVLDAAH